MCRSVDVVDLQEKVQEIGLAGAITWFLVNCDKKNCWSVFRQVKAYQRHFATMQFSAAKGKLPVKSCSQVVEQKKAYLLDTAAFVSTAMHWAGPAAALTKHSVDMPEGMKASHRPLRSCSSLSPLLSL